MIITVYLLENFQADVVKTLLKFFWKQFCSPSERMIEKGTKGQR